MRVSRTGIQLPIILSATILLSGCLAPEKIDAEITTDGCAYALAVDSILADPRAVMAAAEGRLSAQDEEGAYRMAANDSDMPGFQRFDYVGEGRFALVVQLTGALDEPGVTVGFPNTRSQNPSDNFLRMQRLDDGMIEISTPEIPARRLEDLNRLPFRPSGTVRITPAATDMVIDQNADRSPAFLDRAYVWNIENWEDRIFIKIDPAGR